MAMGEMGIDERNLLGALQHLESSSSSDDREHILQPLPEGHLTLVLSIKRCEQRDLT